MTNPVEPLDEKALREAEALTVTSFPPAEQHDVTSHAVPHDGEGAVAWRWKEAEADPAWEFAPFRPMAPGLLVQPLFTHPAPVAAQPAEGPRIKPQIISDLREWAEFEQDGGNVEQGAAIDIILDWYDRQTGFDTRREEMSAQGHRSVRTMKRTTRAMLASSPTPPTAPAVPAAEGWVLVPREPTEAMVEAGIDALREHTELLAIARDPLFVWRYMLSALPAQPNSSDQHPSSGSNHDG